VPHEDVRASHQYKGIAFHDLLLEVSGNLFAVQYDVEAGVLFLFIDAQVDGEVNGDQAPVRP